MTTDRNGWTLWSESPPPKSEDYLILIRNQDGVTSNGYQVGAWDEDDQDFISLIDDEFLTVGKFALWKAVPYPAVVEDMAKLVGAWQA